MKRRRLLIAFVLVAVACVAFWPRIANGIERIVARCHGKYTVEQRLEQYGEAARARLKPFFDDVGVAYPPAKLVFVGLKRENRLEIYAAGPPGELKSVRTYRILAASGELGPKLRYGDGQVPEGIYPVTWLNANSSFHLSMKLGYPNDFDRQMGKKDGREDLGRDIMIHGCAMSCGCLAMGNEAAEDLFVLAADTGIEKIKVILSPVDFRTRDLPENIRVLPSWTNELYETIRAELRGLPRP